LVALALVAAVLCARADGLELAVGAEAPVFYLPAVNTDVALAAVHKPGVSLGDLVGIMPSYPRRAVVLYFFPGQEAGPSALAELEKLQRRFGSRGLQVVAISTGAGGDAEIASLVARRRVSYPVLRDAHGLVTGRYGVTSVPLTLVLDQQGRLYAVGEPGADGLYDSLSKMVPALLKR
jgi:peroxiredoxin